MSSPRRPATIQELAAAADTLAWDPTRPLAAALLDARELLRSGDRAQLARDYDTAFVGYVKFLRLATDLLPNRSPEWYSLNEETKVSIGRDVSEVNTRLSSLRRIIYERHEAWGLSSGASSPHPSLSTPSSSSSLRSTISLRDSVQASTNSMSSSGKLQPSLSVVERTPTVEPKKESRVQKLRRKLGGKKAQPVEPAPEDPPVVEEKRSDEWTMLDAGGSEARQSLSISTAPSTTSRRSEIIYSSPASTATNSTWSQDLVTLIRPSSRASAASIEFVPPTLPLKSSSLVLPGVPFYSPPPPRTDDLRTSRPSQLRKHSSDSNLPSRAMSRAPSQDAGMLGAPKQVHFHAPPPPALVRAPSRLTSRHQQQQGYSPSPSPSPIIPSSIALTTTTPALQPRPAFASVSTSYFSAALASSRSPAIHAIAPTPSAVQPPRLPARVPVSVPSSDGALRTLRLPLDVVSTFVALSMENTDRGIETCGLLLGKIMDDMLTITTLLIPKQTGTSDTCETTHPAEELSFQQAHQVVTLGWIHTHPTQSCFLSSQDLHTHHGFQLDLPESIAIVCAPHSEPSFNTFRLLDPPGMQTIQRCSEPGAFHPHPEGPIYTDVSHGSHVTVVQDLSLQLCDLR